MTSSLGRYEVVEEPGKEGMVYKQIMKEPAKFIFHVKDVQERRFEELVRIILERTSPPNGNIPVSIAKRYHLKPEALPILCWYWEIGIDPVQGVTGDYDGKKWNEDVRRAAFAIVDIVREYVKLEDL